SAVRRGTGRSDPFRTALVAALLFSQPLAKRLEQLVEAARRLNLLLFFLGQVFLRELFQPFGRNVGFDHIIDRFKSFEYMSEDAIEFVQIALVLHQCRAREKIEILHLSRSEIGIHCLHQRQIFAQRHRYAGLLQFLEKSNEHERASLAVLSLDGSTRIGPSQGTVKADRRRSHPHRLAPALIWTRLAPVSTPGPPLQWHVRVLKSADRTSATQKSALTSAGGDVHG